MENQQRSTRIDRVLARPIEIFLACAKERGASEEGWRLRGERLCREEGYPRHQISWAMTRAERRLCEEFDRELELRRQVREVRRAQRAWR